MGGGEGKKMIIVSYRSPSSTHYDFLLPQRNRAQCHSLSRLGALRMMREDPEVRAPAVKGWFARSRARFSKQTAGLGPGKVQGWVQIALCSQHNTATWNKPQGETSAQAINSMERCEHSLRASLIHTPCALLYSCIKLSSNASARCASHTHIHSFFFVSFSFVNHSHCTTIKLLHLWTDRQTSYLER